MKKLILPLLLLVAFGMLAAVESNASAVVGYVKYPCYAGYNFVAVPMGDATTAEALGDLYTPTVSAVSKWNAASQSWESVIYDADFDEWFGTIPVNVGDVVVMLSSGTYDFYSLGTPINTQTYSLSNGFNHLAVPLNRSDIVSAEGLGASIGNISYVSVWSNQNQSWESVIYDADFDEWFGTIPLTIGSVAVPYSNAATVWPTRSIQPRNSK